MINSPVIEYPWSGNVTQDIETSWFGRMEGIPEIEMHVITETASYGTQLDRLIEAVLELAGDPSGDGEKVAALRDLDKDIRASKTESLRKLKARIEALREKLKKLEDREETASGG